MARAESKASAPTVREAQQVAALRVALRGFLRETERAARNSGLTPQRYLLLLLVKGSEAGDERASISELARRLHLAQSTVTELVNRAAEVGLVRRAGSADDARVAYVELTHEGERRLTAAFRALAAERQALLDAVAHLDE